MANEYGPGYWRIDTSGTLTTADRVIDRIIFKPAAANDDVVMKDASDYTFWEVTNALDATPIGDITINFETGLFVRGIKVTTLTAGAVLFIYFEQKG